ncbi:hypothetical protein [Lutibacter sp. B1]|uniref:hypothetical protein n=1 Tax=Lutibacter sp. B1 TaxID=2725996 RepID=UPI001456534E|nr:hypothetical protein [Lutibacter sp. B1]NLP57039.1 hypothetical protein [Lutibacter sp. B1]
MSIINFTIPSDASILKDINNVIGERFIKFIGRGSVCQNIHETIYVRTFQGDDEILRKIVYQKKGTKWVYQTVEVIKLKKSS